MLASLSIVFMLNTTAASKSLPYPAVRRLSAGCRLLVFSQLVNISCFLFIWRKKLDIDNVSGKY